MVSLCKDASIGESSFHFCPKMGPEIRPKHIEFLWKNVWKTNLILDKNDSQLS